MTRTGAKGRTRQCGPTEARKRLADAEKYLEVAQLVGTEADYAPSATVAAGLAVLAAIAAADAASCAALGLSSRSQDHADAGALLKSISPGGDEASKDFGRVIGKKDLAHYSFLPLARNDLKAIMRATHKLVVFAQQTIQRRP
jgi:hypothetical protein